MIHKLIKFICTALLPLSFAHGQSAKEQLSIANAANLVSVNFYEEIPFIDKQGYLTVQVKIDTSTYDYIFDTGGYNTVTTEIMEKANLPTLMEVVVGSSNKIKSNIKLLKVPLMQIEAVQFQNVGVFNFDFSSSPVINCYTDGGLIGKSVIREAIWQIDYRKSVIGVSDNLAKMPLVDKGMKFKIELDNTLNPFLNLVINGKRQKFMLDFGFGGLISLTEKTASSMKFKDVVSIDGEGSIGANGVLAESTYIALIEEVIIGKTKLNNQVAHYSKSNNHNLLGSELAKHFIVTLNFKDKELILTPYDFEFEKTFETFGFNINLDSNSIYISKIYNGLNAQKVGLMVKDEVIGINGIDWSNNSDCEKYFIVNSILRGENEILIQVKRGEEVKEFLIIKQNPFLVLNR